MSDWQTIKASGSILIEDHLKDGSGIRNSRQFLYEVVEAFAKQFISYHNVVGEFPFIYRERQLHSVLFPCIAKVADAAFMEQSVTRKDKENNRSWMIGLLDHVWYIGIFNRVEACLERH